MQTETPVAELLELERRFWISGAQFYRDHVADPCLLAFQQLAGTTSKEEVVHAVGEGPRWESPKILLKGALQPVASVVLLTYEAHAQRPDGEPYAALVSSGYVHQEDGGWRLMFHQQTPLHLPH